MLSKEPFINASQYASGFSAPSGLIKEDADKSAQRKSDQLTFNFKTEIPPPLCQVSHKIIRQSDYPDAPATIQAGWNALAPAIIELSHHVQADGFTLLQSVRRTKNLKGTGSRAAKADTFKINGDVLDSWLYDVLVPIGTLPLENVESSDRFSAAGAERLIRQIKEPYDANISAQSRNEAMMCLEMLCTKVWYERNHGGKSQTDIEQSVFDALEFMYWECGIPNSLAFLWDDPPPLWHPVYEKVREFNYRQLYAVAHEELLASLALRINTGVQALAERRAFFNRRFLRAEAKDVRWGRSFSAQVDVIKARYAPHGDE